MKNSIDDKDRKILEVLKEHGDYTTRQIAKRTLLPITTIHHRIKKLRKEKIIIRYTVELDNKKMDKGFASYILISVNLPLIKQKKKSQYDIAKEVGKYDFVEKVDIVSGGTDLIALVRVKNVEEFDKVLFSKIQQIEGIEKTQSLIVIHSG